jgi:hypothetical protein
MIFCCLDENFGHQGPEHGHIDEHVWILETIAVKELGATTGTASQL